MNKLKTVCLIFAMLVSVISIWVINDNIELVDLKFTNNDVLNFDDIKINKLNYSFTLKNNIENIVNYRLYFDIDDISNIVIKNINMEVIRDGTIQYDDTLDNMLDGNIFDIGNLNGKATSNYEIRFSFKNKSIINKFSSNIKIDSNFVDIGATKVTVTMANNTQREKNFTWHTKTSEDSYLQIVKAKNNNKGITLFDTDDVIEIKGDIISNTFSNYTNRAKVSNLEPGTKYYYRIGNKKSQVWTNVGEFVIDDGDDNFSFLYFSDMQSGVSNAGASIYTALKGYQTNSKSEFMINAGDFVNITNNHDEWSEILKFNVFGNMTSVSAAGNHDYSFFEEQPFAFANHFYYDADSMVNQESGVYYSFDYGNAHFTVLNTNDNFYWDINSMQLEWLRQDLKNAQNKDFRIVVMHRGVYTPGPHFYSYGDIKPLTNQLQPLFAEYNVDLVLQGHDHTFGLTYPINEMGKVMYPKLKNIYSSEINNDIEVMVKPTAPIYFIGGTAGTKYEPILRLKNGIYDCDGRYNITSSNQEIKEFYSKFQKVDTPKNNMNTSLALFSSIEIKNKTLIVNTYSVDNQNKGDVMLYNSFGIAK